MKHYKKTQIWNAGSGWKDSTIIQGAVQNVEKRVENGDGDMVGE